MDTVIVAIISGTSGVVVAILGLIGTVKKINTESSRREQEQNDRLMNIEKKLDEHNGFARLYHEDNKNIALISQKQQDLINSVEKIQKDIDYLKSDRCHV